MFLRTILCSVSRWRSRQADEPPTSWIDPDTGHRVIRLTREPGSASLYFNQNGYTADGKKLVYTTPDGISALDLATQEAKQVVAGPRTAHRRRPEDPARLLHPRRSRFLDERRHRRDAQDRRSSATRLHLHRQRRRDSARRNLHRRRRRRTTIAAQPQSTQGPFSRSAPQQRPDDGGALGRPPADGPLHRQHRHRRNQDDSQSERLAESSAVLAHRSRRC